MKHFHTLLYSILLLGFTLGIHHGSVALWKDGVRTPLTVFPLCADHLPEADRQLLKNGIRAETVSEVTAILEDYLS
jgi:hypothetical protein